MEYYKMLNSLTLLLEKGEGLFDKGAFKPGYALQRKEI